MATVVSLWLALLALLPEAARSQTSSFFLRSSVSVTARFDLLVSITDLGLKG